VSGGFAALAPLYAAHGVATYPCRASGAPAATGYLRVGLAGSRQLALKFAEANAFGFRAGPRNRITVLDVDLADDRLLAEMCDRFGTTLQVRTPSGGWHLYYKHAGEARRIRPMRDVPVDILGDGHVVAAGSVVSRGSYKIERGSLDDLDILPPMLVQQPVPPNRVPRGRRNVELFRFCCRSVYACDTFEQLLDVAETWADDQLAEPLPAAEIRKTCNSVWQYRGGRRGLMNHILTKPMFTALVANLDALALFAYLSAENGPSATFMIADGLGTARGWPRRFVPTARRALLDLGFVECVRRPSFRSPGLYRWKVPTR
jgi:hypothetical protein